ncbi:hypothetical protein TL16_g13120 [Triparma laevis f. inornata]|uniref:Uncharacterized protein n=1 Tax=Triparma laevis f. inornata TaxID=1714386 RepID=A0A9W7BX67_9STRA|nr:hypothetical protein TL16_g13120 [Triparma laevis f. inornata]
MGARLLTNLCQYRKKQTQCLKIWTDDCSEEAVKKREKENQVPGTFSLQPYLACQFKLHHGEAVVKMERADSVVGCISPCISDPTKSGDKIYGVASRVLFISDVKYVIADSVTLFPLGIKWIAMASLCLTSSERFEHAQLSCEEEELCKRISKGMRSGGSLTVQHKIIKLVDRLFSDFTFQEGVLVERDDNNSGNIDDADNNDADTNEDAENVLKKKKKKEEEEEKKLTGNVAASDEIPISLISEEEAKKESTNIAGEFDLKMVGGDGVAIVAGAKMYGQRGSSQNPNEGENEKSGQKSENATKRPIFTTSSQITSSDANALLDTNSPESMASLDMLHINESREEIKSVDACEVVLDEDEGYDVDKAQITSDAIIPSTTVSIDIISLLNEDWQLHTSCCQKLGKWQKVDRRKAFDKLEREGAVIFGHKQKSSGEMVELSKIKSFKDYETERYIKLVSGKKSKIVRKKANPKVKLRTREINWGEKKADDVFTFSEILCNCIVRLLDKNWHNACNVSCKLIQQGFGCKKERKKAFDVLEEDGIIVFGHKSKKGGFIELKNITSMKSVDTLRFIKLR